MSPGEGTTQKPSDQGGVVPASCPPGSPVQLTALAGVCLGERGGRGPAPHVPPLPA